MAADINLIADFLHICLTDDVMRDVLAHSRFQYSMRNADRIEGTAAETNTLRDAPAILINRGLNGRLTSVLTEDEIRK